MQVRQNSRLGDSGPGRCTSLIIPLTDPSWGFDSNALLPYVIGSGFLLAIPISYVIAGIIMKRMNMASPAR